MSGEPLSKSPPLSSRSPAFEFKRRPPYPLYWAWLSEAVLWKEEGAGLEVRLLVPV